MTSVPPTQPPAAPETDVRLTEAEREGLFLAMPDDVTGAQERRIYAAVERIVAERGRVVEGERDAARAESAEAAHRALQAAVEALAAEWDRYGPMAPEAHQILDDLRALAGGEER